MAGTRPPTSPTGGGDGVRALYDSDNDLLLVDQNGDSYEPYS
eukprot:CAMPEP_0194285970 /NCGR_PEP_ID=MMETSP0169-20130528/31484_1 /TAXON_ID=218684 /ORGANISM="Corethron pennatum, Strain L29A3" /LENGTH=41 /DNA_ID= /DNA_START= /DNA_END= /DNA_ORIENTATION=